MCDKQQPTELTVKIIVYIILVQAEAMRVAADIVAEFDSRL